MTPNETFSAVSAFSAIVVALGGMARWVVGVARQADKAMDAVDEIREERTRDKAAFTARLERAEESAASIRVLVSEIKHLGDRIGEHASFAREGFLDIKESQKATEGKLQDLAMQIARLPRT